MAETQGTKPAAASAAAKPKAQDKGKAGRFTDWWKYSIGLGIGLVVPLLTFVFDAAFRAQLMSLFGEMFGLAKEVGRAAKHAGQSRPARRMWGRTRADAARFARDMRVYLLVNWLIAPVFLLLISLIGPPAFPVWLKATVAVGCTASMLVWLAIALVRSPVIPLLAAIGFAIRREAGLKFARFLVALSLFWVAWAFYCAVLPMHQARGFIPLLLLSLVIAVLGVLFDETIARRHVRLIIRGGVMGFYLLTPMVIFHKTSIALLMSIAKIDNAAANWVNNPTFPHLEHNFVGIFAMWLVGVGGGVACAKHNDWSLTGIFWGIVTVGATVWFSFWLLA